MSQEKVAYENYRSSGGTIKWPAFRKYYKEHIKEFTANGDTDELN